MTEEYTPNLLHVNIISAYANSNPTSDEPIYEEPRIFKTGDVLPTEMIRHLDNP